MLTRLPPGGNDFLDQKYQTRLVSQINFLYLIRTRNSDMPQVSGGVAARDKAADMLPASDNNGGVHRLCAGCSTAHCVLRVRSRRLRTEYIGGQSATSREYLCWVTYTAPQPNRSNVPHRHAYKRSAPVRRRPRLNAEGR